MKNEQENQELEQATLVTTPPPFRPTLADKISALGLDEDTASRLNQLTEGIDGTAATDDLLATLVRGITHDADVRNADAEGYLRGRNEKIESVLPPNPEPNDETECTPVFPRYCRRSIWD